MNNIYDQLAEIHFQLQNDEMWKAVIESYFEEFDVSDMEDFLEKASNQENDGAVYALINEGNDLLTIKDDIDNWFTDDDYGDSDYDNY
jgi:hypothetical protein